MRFFSLFIIILFITSCTTVEFVRKETKPQKQAIVRYIPTDSAKKEEKYRADLNKKATKFCDGHYRITKEYQAREVTGNTTGVGTGMAVGMGGVFLGGYNTSTRMYNFVEFTCTAMAPELNPEPTPTTDLDAASKSL